MENLGEQLNNNLHQATLCFLVRGNPVEAILLGFKKTGFGQGKFTGFGGKLEIGETPEQAAIREMEEECGIRILPQDLMSMGSLIFLFPFRPQWSQKVYVYQARQWEGIPIETREMRPAWFTPKDIPYSNMWADARYWMPVILTNRSLVARFRFQEDNETLASVEIDT